MPPRNDRKSELNLKRAQNHILIYTILVSFSSREISPMALYALFSNNCKISQNQNNLLTLKNRKIQTSMDRLVSYIETACVSIKSAFLDTTMDEDLKALYQNNLSNYEFGMSLKYHKYVPDTITVDTTYSQR